MATIVESFPTIKLLEFDFTDPHVYKTWLIDIRALLRRHQLWEYVLRPPPGPYWTPKVIEAADMMTPFLSPNVKRELEPHWFENGYDLLRKLNSMHNMSIDSDGTFHYPERAPSWQQDYGNEYDD